jgi:hypothetical protein
MMLLERQCYFFVVVLDVRSSNLLLGLELFGGTDALVHSRTMPSVVKGARFSSASSFFSSHRCSMKKSTTTLNGRFDSIAFLPRIPRYPSRTLSLYGCEYCLQRTTFRDDCMYESRSGRKPNLKLSNLSP